MNNGAPYPPKTSESDSFSIPTSNCSSNLDLTMTCPSEFTSTSAPEYSTVFNSVTYPSAYTPASVPEYSTTFNSAIIYPPWGQSQSLPSYAPLPSSAQSLSSPPSNYFNNSLTMAVAPKKSSKPPGHIKRPSNCFMIFRRERIASYGKMKAGDASKQVGIEWRALTVEEKEPYIKKAKEIAQLHADQHPWYRYTPQKRNPTIKGKRCSRKTRDALEYISGPNLGFSSAMILEAQMGQEAPGFVRISNSLPYKMKRKQLKKQKKPSKLNHAEIERFGFEASLSVLQSSRSHPFYMQSKSSTAPPQPLLFVHSQAPLINFIPSVSTKLPTSDSPVTPTPSLITLGNNGYINSQEEGITLPSQSNEKATSAIYLNQLMSANFAVAMNLSPPGIASVQELTTGNNFYPQYSAPEVDYQKFIASGLPCPIPKSTMTMRRM